MFASLSGRPLSVILDAYVDLLVNNVNLVLEFCRVNSEEVRGWAHHITEIIEMADSLSKLELEHLRHDLECLYRETERLQTFMTINKV